MLRRVESVFQGGKKFSIFFSFSGDKNQSGCDHYTQENPRDIFIYYVEKFKLLAQLVFS